MEAQGEILILLASPRTNGSCANFAHKLASSLRDTGTKLCLFELSQHYIAPCTGCAACERDGRCVIAGDAWELLAKHIESCRSAVVVAPLYFAGPPAQFKAALDRCQVYWVRKRLLHKPMPARRPAYLVVLGAGGDPFGSKPLESICTSAFNCANLYIDKRITHLIKAKYDTDKAQKLIQRLTCELTGALSSPSSLNTPKKEDR